MLEVIDVSRAAEMDDVSGLACLMETLMYRERLLLNTLLWLACAIALLSAVFCLKGYPGFGIDVVSGSSRRVGTQSVLHS